MQDNDIGILLIFQTLQAKLVVNEYTRLKRFSEVILDASELEWLLKVLPSEGFDFNETFSLVYSEDSFKVIRYLLLISIGNCTKRMWERRFLNRQPFVKVHMSQLEGFKVNGKEHMM